MSTTDPQDDAGETDNTVTLKRSQIRALEKAASDNERLTKELELLKRNEAFREAGVDLKDPKITYFVKGYEGELTPESIRKAAEESGFIAPPQLTDEQSHALSVSTAAAVAANGGQPMAAMSPEGMKAEMEKALESGGVEAMMAVASRYGAHAADEFR